MTMLRTWAILARIIVFLFAARAVLAMVDGGALRFMALAIGPLHPDTP